MMRIGIVGAGLAGLSAGYDLAQAGHEVVIFEATEQVGGLASGFCDQGWDWSLERFYHHWFANDEDMLKILRELGLSEKVVFERPVTAMYFNGQFYAFDSPIAVLKFPGIPLVDRIRFGMVAAYLRVTKNWKALEKYTAAEWLVKYTGKRAYEVLWKPMLQGKFGNEYYEKVNMAWFWARISKRTPRLGTYVGGFQACCDDIAQALKNKGVQFRFATPVQACTGQTIQPVSGEPEPFGKVLVTGSPQLMNKLCPTLPSTYLDALQNMKSLGAVVIVLAMTKPLGKDIYWYNLPKSEGFPFLCMVEHTKYMNPQHYGGDHILYCGDYLPTDHTYFSMTKEELLEAFTPTLQKFNPEFDASWVRALWKFSETYAQPVPFVNHSQHIPEIKTPVDGLFWASMSQVYPWDRGTNYAVEIGRRAARLMLEDA